MCCRGSASRCIRSRGIGTDANYGPLPSLGVGSQHRPVTRGVVIPPRITFSTPFCTSEECAIAQTPLVGGAEGQRMMSRLVNASRSTDLTLCFTTLCIFRWTKIIVTGKHIIRFLVCPTRPPCAVSFSSSFASPVTSAFDLFPQTFCLNLATARATANSPGLDRDMRRGGAGGAGRGERGGRFSMGGRDDASTALLHHTVT